ncbi:MAG: type II toxin-antitoxin system VapC family toxin [Methanoregulaceae archaeon]
MPVADTSFIIDLIRREPGAIRIYEQYESQGIALSTTAITAMELYKGAYVSGNRKNVEKVGSILGVFILLPVDEAVHEVFGKIAAGLCPNGKPISDFDEVIAAITLCSDGEIITRDPHFRNIPGLTAIGY